MSLPLLVNSADCGPVNPLQNLGKRFDQDRGAQQDHFGAGHAGSSRQVFRTVAAAAPGVTQDAARFFNAPQTNQSQITGVPTFDLSTLRANLPSPQTGVLTRPGPNMTSWASDFMKQLPDTSSSTLVGHRVESPTLLNQVQVSPTSSAQMGFRTWSPPAVGLRMNTMPTFSTAMVPQSQQPVVHSRAISWDKQFQTLEQTLAAQTSQNQQEAIHKPSTQTRPDDELARTAALLINAVQHEENPKFKNSQFMSLMRQLRDGEMTVEGNEMVATSESTSSTRLTMDPSSSLAESSSTSIPLSANYLTNIKGKGRAMNVGLSEEAGFADYTRDFLAQQEVHEVATSSHALEDENDAYFAQDNADYMAYWDSMERAANAQRIGTTAQGGEWDRLQGDWDRFEATASGISRVANYQFQANNPYLLGEASGTRHHTMHSGERHSLFESVLELEAAVQRDPHNVEAWFALGVKQQENEREQAAIHALLRALELAPEHAQARLALAVSQTNEGQRFAAYEAIQDWVRVTPQYASALAAHRAANPERADWSQSERFSDMIRCLVGIAAATPPGGELDADVQIALAVLLNINEEWEKSGDCFRTALAVRPEDWLLWNRVGATLANSGRADEALQYYSRALELNPVYIRARYNTGIALINLRRYGDAAEHLLDALALQDSDGTKGMNTPEDKRAITSSSLWDSLKTACIHMQRLDLSTMCERRDLDAFRMAFEGGAA